MSFKFTSAHSSRIKKSSKPPSLTRHGSSSFSSLPRRKPIQRTSSQSKPKNEENEQDDDRLTDTGLIQTLSTDLTLRDVPQAIKYIRSKTFSPLPESRSGLSSTRIAEILNFRKNLPPVVTVAHVQALLNSATAVEREIAQLCGKGVVRKICVPTKGTGGELLILVSDLEALVRQSSLSDTIKERFLNILKDNPTALKLPRTSFAGQEEVKELMHAGFLTAATPTWTTTEVFSTPGQGSKGTMTSLNSISRAASGSWEAVGGEGAVHAAGGSSASHITHSQSNGSGNGNAEYSLALPSTGPYLKLAHSARSHLVSLLGKSKFRECPESVLRERWEVGIEVQDERGRERRNRREFDGVLPGKTRKWRAFWGVGFEWVLGEAVGVGQVEVFETGSVGRGVRAI